ncbi:RagB/SusD family nutrient uptake outer membrane protein [Ancylomarina euxinus]|nr:RagB/SusD family nutrient uptake outer membrane protein [Ancylomarina euxinus]MCZ4695574.1 RagB/SusD family nutrient uptake outer membrane protein [Ancylomarina euxinus]
MKNIYIILIAILLSSCSADEFLDVKPTGVVIPESVNDFDMLMQSPTMHRSNWTNLNYWDPDVLLSDKMLNLIQSSKSLVNQYKWAENIYSVSENDEDWNILYSNIYVYNTIIKEIDDAPLGLLTETDRIRVKGEAYGQRAMEYFLLACEYVPAYSTDTKDKLAIPMPMEANITVDIPKSTVGEIYNQILSDLKVAAPLLENAPAINQEANFRPGLASVKGLLALVSLHMGDFAAAKTYSSEALVLYNHLYDYTTFSNKRPGDAWSGLNIDDFTLGLNDKSVIWSRINQWSYSFPYDGHLYHPDLRALFDQVNDQRYILFSSSKANPNSGFGDLTVSPNVAYASKDKASQAGLSVANLTLVQAEACIRTNDKDGAVNALNTLLVKRIKSFTPLVASDFADNTAVLNKVKQERRKELMATGNYLIDLKRYHALGESIPTFTRVINSKTHTLEPGSSKYALPIPLKVQALNSNL